MNSPYLSHKQPTEYFSNITPGRGHKFLIATSFIKLRNLISHLKPEQLNLPHSVRISISQISIRRPFIILPDKPSTKSDSIADIVLYRKVASCIVLRPFFLIISTL